LEQAILTSPGLFTEDKILARSYIDGDKFSSDLDSLKRRVSFRNWLNWLNSLPDEELHIYLL